MCMSILPVILYVLDHVYYVCVISTKDREGIVFLGTGDKDSCELPCIYRESNAQCL